MDETILQAIINTHTKQVSAILATIIHTEGSTPRDPGTQMLIIETGQTVGTIGGGTTEKLVTKRALELLKTGSSLSERYYLVINQDTVSDNSPVCGANMDVLLEPVQEKKFWQFAHNLQMNGKDGVLVTSLLPPYPKSIVDSAGKVLFGPIPTDIMLRAEKSPQICSSMPAGVIETSAGTSWFIEPVLRKERLLILGAGHVARGVAYYAKPLDFQVTVIDDRREYALPEFFPGVHAVICSDFASGIKNYQPNRDTFVVIATYSHPTDAECLKDILNFPTKYVGMLGSKKKIATITNYLQAKGYTSEQLDQLRAPIGLDIRAQTPSEIALSILAEIISVRRSG